MPPWRNQAFGGHFTVKPELHRSFINKLSGSMYLHAPSCPIGKQDLNCCGLTSVSCPISLYLSFSTEPLGFLFLWGCGDGWVYMCVCTHVCRCPRRPKEGIRSLGSGVTDNGELPIWVLETELWSSGKAASALNHRNDLSRLSIQSPKIVFDLRHLVTLQKLSRFPPKPLHFCTSLDQGSLKTIQELRSASCTAQREFSWLELILMWLIDRGALFISCRWHCFCLND